jgi:hypothetical protein
MMNVVSQEVIDLLAEAAGAGRSLIIELHDGRRFADGVCDVNRQCGEDFVIFHANNRMMIRDIARATRCDRQDDDSECIEGDPAYALAPGPDATA